MIDAYVVEDTSGKVSRRTVVDQPVPRPAWCAALYVHLCVYVCVCACVCVRVCVRVCACARVAELEDLHVLNLQCATGSKYQ